MRLTLLFTAALFALNARADQTRTFMGTFETPEKKPLTVTLYPPDVGSEPHRSVLYPGRATLTVKVSQTPAQDGTYGARISLSTIPPEREGDNSRFTLSWTVRIQSSPATARALLETSLDWIYPHPYQDLSHGLYTERSERDGKFVFRLGIFHPADNDSHGVFRTTLKNW